MTSLPVTRSPHGQSRYATVRSPEGRSQLGIAEATLAIRKIRTRVVNSRNLPRRGIVQQQSENKFLVQTTIVEFKTWHPHVHSQFPSRYINTLAFPKNVGTSWKPQGGCEYCHPYHKFHSKLNHLRQGIKLLYNKDKSIIIDYRKACATSSVGINMHYVGEKERNNTLTIFSDRKFPYLCENRGALCLDTGQSLNKE